MHSEIKTLEFRLVRLNDEIACGLITDLSDYFNLRLSLQQQNKLLRLLVDNITSLLILPVESGNSDTIINNLLGIIGQHIEADRVYYFKYYWNEGYTKNTHEWCNIGIKPEIENLQHVQLNLIPEWASAHDKGQTIFISDTMNLPDCPLRDLLLSQNIKSLIAVPAMLGKKCVGFVGFDFVNNYHNTPKEEEIILLTLARAIANFEHRREIYNTLVEYNAKIEESERLKSAILANFSHEIRTPLNGIIGSAELIMNEAIDIKELKEYTLCILESSYRLLEFLTNVIDLSQVESGIKGIHLEKVKLSEIIESVQVQFSSKAAKKNLILKTTLSDDLKNLLLHTDSEKIQRILYNLVENGIKFTETGHVELECLIEGNIIIFNIKDTGKGIAPEHLNRIFEPFYQTDYSFNRGWEGAGIGLAVAKNFAKLLGGSIEVISQEGKGSTFTFKMPIKINQK